MAAGSHSRSITDHPVNHPAADGVGSALEPAGTGRPALRLAIVTSAHPPLDKRIYERQARFLARRGLEVHLVAPWPAATPVAAGITLHPVPWAPGRLARFRLHRKIGAHVRRIAPDIVHFHDPDLLLSVAALRGGRRPIVVYDAHEDFPLGVRQPLRIVVDLVERFFARRVDGVICAHRHRLGQLRPGPTGFYLPGYPMLDAFPPPLAGVVRERSCLYLGLLGLERGAETILEAASRAPDIRWVMIGDFPVSGDRDGFLARAQRLGLKNLEWGGMVPFSKVPALLARAGVGIMPWLATPMHRWAAQPTKLYEYMAAGLPIVASRLPITEEVVEQTGTGLLHPADDAAALVECARRILDDPATAAGMSAAGRAAFVDRFNFDRLGPELVAWYERLLGARIPNLDDTR